MTLSEQHTQVCVIGAGPSGLMMAAQLLRYGIQPIIIDSKQGPTTHSKALAVQARSLEIYRQMGVIDRIISGGKQAKGVSFNQEGKIVASLSLANVGKDQTAFPFIHLYQQSKNERLLLDFLTQNCCPVYWETEMISLNQSGKQVEVQLQSGAEKVTITCDWLIGADGAHSTVRKQLQIPFNGDTHPNEFFLADVELDNQELDNDDVSLFLSPIGFAGFFPMPEDKSFRIIGNLPNLDKGGDELILEEVLPGINTITTKDIKIVHNNWFTTYRLHHRMADNFRKEHCFLIGDAAHIHSPVGGQGMNTGLQDAYNLAWKLAAVVNGQIDEYVLNSYGAERMPVAKDLLNTTDKIFKLILSQNWLASVFKKWVMPRLLRFAWSKENIREIFFRRVSQIDINYRDSNINLHLSNATEIKAGDRLPYLKLFDEKKQEETDLHEWCTKPGFTLIVLGNLNELDLFTLAKWLTQTYLGYINFFYLPPSKKNTNIFNTFQVKTSRAKTLIVRPDMHIGFMNDAVDIPVMDNYLQNVMGINKSPGSVN